MITPRTGNFHCADPSATVSLSPVAAAVIKSTGKIPAHRIAGNMSFGDFARIAWETQMVAAMLTLEVMSGIDVSGGGFAGLIRLGPQDPDPEPATGGELDFATRYSMFGGGGRPDFARNGSNKLSFGQKVLNFLAKALESPLGIVVAAVVGVAVIAGAVLAGVGLAAALIIGATAAFVTQAAVGALDVATGGGMGRAVGEWAGPWMSAFKGVLGAVYIAGAAAQLVVMAEGIAAMGGISALTRKSVATRIRPLTARSNPRPLQHIGQPGSGKSIWKEGFKAVRSTPATGGVPYSRLIRYKVVNGKKVPIQTGIYDRNGDLVAHIDWDAGNLHGHKFPPGMPHLGHGAEYIHYPPH